MRTFKASKGPFAEGIYFTNGEIDRICLDELRKCNLLPEDPNPIRIDRFVEKRFNVSAEPFDLEEGILGFTIFNQSGVQAIYYSKSLDSEDSASAARRVRSTIGHEAGHGLLHAHLFVLSSESLPFGAKIDGTSSKVLCRETSNAGQLWEFHANEAMSHLLLPTPLVRKAVEPFLVSAGLFGVTQIQPDRREAAARELAEVFDVNPVMVRIRLEKLYPAVESIQLAL